MSTRVACARCGALNSTQSEYCTLCFHPRNGHDTAVTHPGGTRRPREPIDLPHPGVIVRPQAEPVVPEPAASNWKWRDLGVLFICTWLVPGAYTSYIAPKLRGARLADTSLGLEILGYLAALAVIAFLVRRRNHGDWGSLGLDTPDRLNDLRRGATFGFILLMAWSPIAFLLNRGGLRFEEMIRALIGETSQLGLLLAAVVVVAGAPVIEEIFFRGILYSKFSRRGPGAAIVGTSMLFVMVHGALIIPALMVLAFGLGWKRQTESLWYTIGAHSAWNAVIIGLAAWLMLGPAHHFSPPDGAYSLRHSSEWQRISEFEKSGAHGIVDLALESSNGSLVIAARFDPPAVEPEKALPAVLDALGRPTPGAKTLSPPGQSRYWYPGSPPTYEATYQQEVDRVQCLRMASQKACAEAVKLGLRSNLVAVLPASGGRVVVFNLLCAVPRCKEAAADFDDLMSSIKFRTP